MKSPIKKVYELYKNRAFEKKAREDMIGHAGVHFTWPLAGKSAGARAHAETLALMVNEPDISPEQLHALTMPTLVVAGTKDMIRRSHTEEIAKNLPNATALFLPGHHFVAAGNPEAFNAAVLDFLKG